MFRLTEGIGGVRIGSLWLLCEVERGRIVLTQWSLTWDGDESESLRALYEAACVDGRVAFPYVTLRGTSFQRRVWCAAMGIPYGSTKSYGAVAQGIGCRSAQAVGQALKQNRIYWFVPCHRIVQAKAGLGGYRPGIAIKRDLLAFEACTS